MSWVEIEAMKKCRWISFGGHTMHHPILTCLTDSSEVEYEVRESRIELEHHLQSPVRSFAYPVGKFGEQAIRCVQKAGYVWALTTIKGLNTPQTNPYLLHRLSVDPWQHWLYIAVRVSDMRHFFTNFLRVPIKFLLRLAK
jgi:peptidoglycan/xylan/chitin deacetylase (PgdA/CDA1 family)